MGSRSKKKALFRYHSSRNMKQWCKARGLDFASYMTQFPLARVRYFIETKQEETKGVEWWIRFINFIRKIMRMRPCPQPQQ